MTEIRQLSTENHVADATLRALIRARRVDPAVLADDPFAAPDDTAAETVTEATVLHHLIISPASRQEVFERVDPADFHDPQALAAYRRLLDADASGTNLSSPAIRRMWQIEYRAIAMQADKSRAWHEAMQTLIDQAVRRRVWLALDDATIATARPDTTLPELRERLEAISESAVDRRMWTQPPTMREIVKMTLNRLEQIHNGTLSSLPLGIRCLDDMLNILPGNLIVVGARPSVGKSAFANSIQRNLALRGIPSGLFSFEMGYEDCTCRLACMESRVPYTVLHKPTGRSLSQVEWAAHMAAMTRISKWPTQMYCAAALTVGEIRRMATEWVRSHGVRLIIVDYLQLIRTPHVRGSQKRYEVVGEISRALKALAMDLQTPIMVLAQISRAGANAMPRTEHLRESGDIEQDADTILLLDRPDADKPAPGERPYQDIRDGQTVIADMTDRAAVIVSKHRNGETGYRLIQFDAPIMHFHDFNPEQFQ